VTGLFYQGEHVQATAELPDGQKLTLRLDRSQKSVGTGDTLSIDIDPASVHVIESTE
jgi:putative spermidine/putrescine transport system ATP-binding protein